MVKSRKPILAGGIQVGKIFPTKDGDVFVLEIQHANRVRIIFLEYPCELFVRSGNLKTGGIHNPIKPNVCGVGFLGIGPHVAKRDYIPNPTHQVWHDMLKRAYTPRTTEEARNYAGTSVHPHWHNFQNFADWYHERVDRFGSVDFTWQLDKDLLVPGNRQYGPDACCMVPKHVNTLFTDHAFGRGKYPLGVSKDERQRGAKYIASVSGSAKSRRIGRYHTIPDAQRAYWSEKFRVIQETAIRYWQYLPEPLAWRLLTFGWDDALAYYGDDARIWSE